MARSWKYDHPPNTDFNINLASEQSRGLKAWLSFVNGRKFIWPNAHFISGTFDLASSVAGRGIYSDGTSALNLRTSGFGSGVSSSKGCVVLRAVVYNQPSGSEPRSVLSARNSADTGDFARIHQTPFYAGYPMQGAIRENTTYTYPILAQEPTLDVYTVGEHSVWALNWSFDGSEWSGRFVRADWSGILAVVDTTTTTANWSGSLDEFILIERDTLAVTAVEGRLYNRWVSDDEVWALWEPNTRWELYEPRVRLWPVATSGTPVWSSPVNHSEIGAVPTLEFTSASFSGNAHFNMELDKVDTFDGGNLRSIKTNVSTTGWEYWDGDSWEAFPSTGLPDTYSGNNVRYTVQSALSEGTWYRRVRQG